MPQVGLASLAHGVPWLMVDADSAAISTTFMDVLGVFEKVAEDHGITNEKDKATYFKLVATVLGGFADGKSVDDILVLYHNLIMPSRKELEDVQNNLFVINMWREENGLGHWPDVPISVEKILRRLPATNRPLDELEMIIKRLFLKNTNINSLQSILVGMLGYTAIENNVVSDLLKYREYYISGEEEAMTNMMEAREKFRSTTNREPVILPPGSKVEATDKSVLIKIPHPKTEVPHVELIKVSSLPKYIRPLFPHQTLNVVQTLCFDNVYNSINNVVVSAPTGSGKTNLALLSISKLIKDNLVNYMGPDVDMTPEEVRVIIPEIMKNSLVVYLTPMKALSTEITVKFTEALKSMSLTVTECTGDTLPTLKEIISSHVIVATPEKWDLLQRRYNGIDSPLNILKLMIIDEIHLIGTDRGFVIESIIAHLLREIENTQSFIRIIGLSATIPNIKDIGHLLLCRDDCVMEFGREYRPTPIDMVLVGMKETNLNKRRKTNAQNRGGNRAEDDPAQDDNGELDLFSEIAQGLNVGSFSEVTITDEYFSAEHYYSNTPEGDVAVEPDWGEYKRRKEAKAKAEKQEEENKETEEEQVHFKRTKGEKATKQRGGKKKGSKGGRKERDEDDGKSVVVDIDELTDRKKMKEKEKRDRRTKDSRPEYSFPTKYQIRGMRLAISELIQDRNVMFFVHSRNETEKLACLFLKVLKHFSISMTNTLQCLRKNASRTPREDKEKKSLEKWLSKLDKTDSRFRAGVDKSLDELMSYGIGCHHAGMSRTNRLAVEQLFRQRNLHIVFSTSTLAWGVNLPADSVIIAGTEIVSSGNSGRYYYQTGGDSDVEYVANEGMKRDRLSPLDVVQIFGRAGRPQYYASGGAEAAGYIPTGYLVAPAKDLRFYVKSLLHQNPLESTLLNTTNTIVISCPEAIKSPGVGEEEWKYQQGGSNLDTTKYSDPLNRTIEINITPLHNIMNSLISSCIITNTIEAIKYLSNTLLNVRVGNSVHGDTGDVDEKKLSTTKINYSYYKITKQDLSAVIRIYASQTDLAMHPDNFLYTTNYFCYSTIERVLYDLAVLSMIKVDTLGISQGSSLTTDSLPELVEGNNKAEAKNNTDEGQEGFQAFDTSLINKDRETQKNSTTRNTNGENQMNNNYEDDEDSKLLSRLSSLSVRAVTSFNFPLFPTEIGTIASRYYINIDMVNSIVVFLMRQILERSQGDTASSSSYFYTSSKSIKLNPYAKLLYFICGLSLFNNGTNRLKREEHNQLDMLCSTIDTVNPRFDNSSKGSSRTSGEASRPTQTKTTAIKWVPEDLYTTQSKVFLILQHYLSCEPIRNLGGMGLLLNGIVSNLQRLLTAMVEIGIVLSTNVAVSSKPNRSQPAPCLNNNQSPILHLCKLYSAVRCRCFPNDSPLLQLTYKVNPSPLSYAQDVIARSKVPGLTKTIVEKLSFRINRLLVKKSHGSHNTGGNNSEAQQPQQSQQRYSLEDLAKMDKHELGAIANINNDSAQIILNSSLHALPRVKVFVSYKDKNNGSGYGGIGGRTSQGPKSLVLSVDINVRLISQHVSRVQYLIMLDTTNSEYISSGEDEEDMVDVKAALATSKRGASLRTATIPKFFFVSLTNQPKGNRTREENTARQQNTMGEESNYATTESADKTAKNKRQQQPQQTSKVTSGNFANVNINTVLSCSVYASEIVVMAIPLDFTGYRIEQRFSKKLIHPYLSQPQILLPTPTSKFNLTGQSALSCAGDVSDGSQGYMDIINLRRMPLLNVNSHLFIYRRLSGSQTREKAQQTSSDRTFVKVPVQLPIANIHQVNYFHKCLYSSSNVLVASPTGSGKTTAAVYCMIRELRARPLNTCRGIILYISPVKALIGEMFELFNKIFNHHGGDANTKGQEDKAGQPRRQNNVNISVLTGDTGIDKLTLLHSEILLATPEKIDILYRNSNINGSDTSRTSTLAAADSSESEYTDLLVSLLIIDELHMLNSDRGGILESIIARTLYANKINEEKLLASQLSQDKASLNALRETHRPIRICGLSTTLSNVDEISNWINGDVLTPNNTRNNGDQILPPQLKGSFEASRINEKIKKRQQKHDEFISKAGSSFSLDRRFLVDLGAQVHFDTETQKLVKGNLPFAFYSSPLHFTLCFSANSRPVHANIHIQSYNDNANTSYSVNSQNTSAPPSHSLTSPLSQENEKPAGSANAPEDNTECDHTSRSSYGDVGTGAQKSGFCQFNAMLNTPLISNISRYTGLTRAIAQDSTTSSGGRRNVIIFCSSRRQCRLTAFAIINSSVCNSNNLNALEGIGANPTDNEGNEIILLSAKDKAKEHDASLINPTEAGDTTICYVEDSDLLYTLQYGVGMHHAGLSKSDKGIVETLFRVGAIGVLLSTATLAWGINLPCHTVIIKGLKYYDNNTSAYKMYSMTDIMQMVGRAGRPQFVIPKDSIDFLAKTNDRRGQHQTGAECDCVIMCTHEEKLFLKEFLTAADSFTVRSHLTLNVRVPSIYDKRLLVIQESRAANLNTYFDGFVNSVIYKYLYPCMYAVLSRTFLIRQTVAGQGLGVDVGRRVEQVEGGDAPLELGIYGVDTWKGVQATLLTLVGRSTKSEEAAKRLRGLILSCKNLEGVTSHFLDLPSALQHQLICYEYTHALTREVLQRLEAYGCIRKVEETEMYVSTNQGRIASQYYIHPKSTLTLGKGLKEMAQLVEDNKKEDFRSFKLVLRMIEAISSTLEFDSIPIRTCEDDEMFEIIENFQDTNIFGQSIEDNDDKSEEGDASDKAKCVVDVVGGEKLVVRDFYEYQPLLHELPWYIESFSYIFKTYFLIQYLSICQVLNLFRLSNENRKAEQEAKARGNNTNTAGKKRGRKPQPIIHLNPELVDQQTDEEDTSSSTKTPADIMKAFVKRKADVDNATSISIPLLPNADFSLDARLVSDQLPRLVSASVETSLSEKENFLFNIASGILVMKSISNGLPVVSLSNSTNSRNLVELYRRMTLSSSNQGSAATSYNIIKIVRSLNEVAHRHSLTERGQRILYPREAFAEMRTTMRNAFGFFSRELLDLLLEMPDVVMKMSKATERVEERGKGDGKENKDGSEKGKDDWEAGKKGGSGVRRADGGSGGYIITPNKALMGAVPSNLYNNRNTDGREGFIAISVKVTVNLNYRFNEKRVPLFKSPFNSSKKPESWLLVIGICEGPCTAEDVHEKSLMWHPVKYIRVTGMKQSKEYVIPVFLSIRQGRIKEVGKLFVWLFSDCYIGLDRCFLIDTSGEDGVISVSY